MAFARSKLALLGVFVLLTGCQYYVDKLPEEPPPDVTNMDTPPTYQLVYNAVLKPKCSQCHTGAENRDFFDIADYTDLLNNMFYENLIVPGDPDGSRLVEAIQEGRMPKEGRPVEPWEMDLIKLWISEGALE